MTKTRIKNPAPKFIHLKKLHDYVIEQKEVIGIEGVREIIQPYLTKQYTYDLFNDFGFEYACTHNIFTDSFNKNKLKKLIETKELFEKFSFLDVKELEDIKDRRYLNNVSNTVCKISSETHKHYVANRRAKEQEDKRREVEAVYYNPIYFKKSKESRKNYFNNILELIDGIESIKGRELLTNNLLTVFTYPFSLPQRNQLQEKKQILQNILDKENEAVKIDSIDLSESKGIDKIRYLIELGVLDFLKTKAIVHSNNALASAVSGITGVKQTTVQPYINAYFTDTFKNNPLSNAKEMDKIKHTLNKLGYIKDE